MISPHLDPTDSSGHSGLESTKTHSLSDGEAGTEGFDTARLGVMACILFMVGGLYWTASVGLLTLSALKAYPVMIGVGGTVIALFVLGTTLWTSGGPVSDSTGHPPTEDSNTPCLGTYDSVTGLPTNRLFTSLLNQALTRARKNGRQVAILMVEMDHFTLTTELHGQVNRNLVYRVQAARVKSALRTTDCVARLAERTFAVLLDHVTDHEEVVAAAKKMQATVSLPVTLDGHEIFLTSRIGISLSTCDDAEGVVLVESATRAVATARAEGYALYGLHGAVVTPQVDSAATIAA
ncbi:MAG: GGDEF domain-containing protein [Nitrospira defluvii]|nr:GGDEF domain-containing protein [Nitrospira defluvii]